FNFVTAGAPATIGGAPFTAGMLRGYLSSNTSTSNTGVITDPQLASNGATNSDQDNFDDGLKQATGFYALGVLSEKLVIAAPEPLGEITKPSGTTGGATPGHNNTVDGTAGGTAIADNNSNVTVDFGFYTQCLGNVVFEDNGAGGGTALNGLKDGSEPGLNGVTLKLYSADGMTEINVGPDGILGTPDDAPGGIVTATVSGVDGTYKFGGLPAGSYKVRVTIPAGLNSTADTAGTPAPDGNVDNDDNLVGVAGGAQLSPAISLVAGAEPTVDNATALTTNNTLDFGVARAYSLGNRVWKDLDNSGTLNGAEVGVQGVVLRLLKGDLSPATDLSGANVANQTTDASGYYRFDNLATGDYVVEVLASNFTGTGKLVGCLSSSVDAGDPDSVATDSDDNGTGITPSATDGIRSLAVTLGEGTGAAEPTTDNDPATNPAAGETVNGQSNRTVDFGFIPTYSLGNRVWKDLNNSGTLDGAEVGVDGVVLRLLKAGVQATDANGVLVADQTTASGGYYRFDNLATGDYVVEVRASNFIGTGALAGCVSSGVNAGDPDTDLDDSDDNGLGVTPSATDGIRSDAITLGPAVNSEPTTEADRSPTDPTEPNGMTNLTLDFGFMPTFALGNRVWKDLDNNGALNGSEAGITGVVLRLLNAATLAQATDAAGVLVADQTTVAGGYYRFDNLLGGDYVVEVRASNFSGTGVLLSCVSSSINAGDPDTDVDDSDDNGIGVAPDAANGIRSAAITLGPAIGSEPTTEADRSGTDPAEPNGNTNLTLDFGFTGLYSLGNRVWKDVDDSGTLNNSEAGINGVVVKLLTAALAPASDIYGNPVANQTTAGGGYYRFDNLATGDYVVEIAAANFTGTGVLVGCNSSTPDAGDPDTDVDDSDDSGIGLSPDATNGIRSAAITLGDGNGAAEPTTDNDPTTNPQAGESANNQSNRTVDFGFRPVMTIGNLVWKDQNNNGKYEVPESLLENITLRLYRDNGDNTFNLANDTLVQTIQSNNLGFYQFANLLPGNYFVWVDQAEFANGGDLFGCFSSTGGNVSNSDTDNEDDGVDVVTPSATGVVSPMVTLVFQNEPTTDGDDNNGNQTIDFGFYTPLALGNLVWKDLNNDGNYQLGEPLLENVKVNLFKDANNNQAFDAATDTPVDSKLTNAAGEYGFTGLLPGDYFVQVDKSNFAPTGVLFGCVSSAGNSTADNNTDNNDDGVDNTAPATNGITSTFIALLGGTEPSPDGRANATVDFGITPTFSLGNRVWKDLDNSGTINGTESVTQGLNGVVVR
ncbi:MAG: hypothetical protein HOP19_17010, partial [Acidobacteria bacterium]|nr:hypothetical protein [Acidobacteriota bacterium]